MSVPHLIDINQYSYELPDSRIARYPLEKRDNSRLLVCKPNSPLVEDTFSRIANYLPSGSLVISNNTRVIHARLGFQKKTGAQIELFCLSPYKPADYQLALSATESSTWHCLVGNLKKWKQETLELGLRIQGKHIVLKAQKARDFNTKNCLIDFRWEGGFSFAEVLKAAGSIPIPPYLNRSSEEIDSIRYQTVYSKFDGSVAAPTAGLHFTPEVFTALSEKMIEHAEITLHVGAGTFRPVKNTNAREHEMHAERIIINAELLEKIIQHHGMIVATGTTSLRTLESIYWLGIKLLIGDNAEKLGQWEWESLPQEYAMEESLQALLSKINNLPSKQLIADTEIMIVPGYRFCMADALITNFHQPQSTLLLLIAAFIGDKWPSVYDYALRNGFRFLSYGDSSLLFREK